MWASFIFFPKALYIQFCTVNLLHIKKVNIIPHRYTAPIVIIFRGYDVRIVKVT